MSTKTIMIVDDDPGVQEALEAILDTADYQCILADDGIDALNKLQQTHPDLMLVDLMMPRMSGVELIQELDRRSLRNAIPIIVLSAHGKNVDMQHLPIQNFLSKPFEIDELLHMIARLLQ